MPRKGRTAAIKNQSKPKLPDGDEGSNLTQKERENKLNVFLLDFDEKVESQKLKMQKDLKDLMVAVSRAFVSEITSIPLDVRKMTLQEFIDCGGTIDSAISTNRSTTDRIRTVISSRVLSGIDQNYSTCDTIMEEEHGTTQRSTRKNNSTLSSAMKSRKAPRKNASSAMMPPPAAPSSSYKSYGYQTPQQGRSLAATGWATPLITPKFDPRLPVTPAQQREANPGEILLSLGGSPVNNPRDRRQKGESILVRGKTLTVNLDLENCPNFDNLQIPDSTDIENLPFKTQVSAVMNVLADLLKREQEENQ